MSYIIIRTLVYIDCLTFLYNIVIIHNMSSDIMSIVMLVAVGGGVFYAWKSGMLDNLFKGGGGGSDSTDPCATAAAARAEAMHAKAIKSADFVRATYEGVLLDEDEDMIYSYKSSKKKKKKSSKKSSSKSSSSDSSGTVPDGSGSGTDLCGTTDTSTSSKNSKKSSKSSNFVTTNAMIADYVYGRPEPDLKIRSYVVSKYGTGNPITQTIFPNSNKYGSERYIDIAGTQ